MVQSPELVPLRSRALGPWGCGWWGPVLRGAVRCDLPHGLTAPSRPERVLMFYSSLTPQGTVLGLAHSGAPTASRGFSLRGLLQAWLLVAGSRRQEGFLEEVLPAGPGSHGRLEELGGGGQRLSGRWG